MENETHDLDRPIGTKEQTKLKEGTVKIQDVSVEEETNKEGRTIGKKVITMCKHPDRDEMIQISSVKYVFGDKIKSSGLWYNLDDDGNIAKNSALATLMTKLKIETVAKLKELEVQTELDDNGYLSFKAY